jgi:hypothetical protein
MNPSAPHIHGTLKLHKQAKSIRPIVIWIDSPGYKLAKHLNTILNNILQLPNAEYQHTSSFTEACRSKRIYTTMFIRHRKHVHKYPNTRSPIRRDKNIIDKNYNLSQEMKVEIIDLLNTILEQNYIEHNGKWYKQNDGLAMGAPT